MPNGGRSRRAVAAARGLPPLPPFNPVADTVNALAALGAADRRVMTLAFVAVGLCDAVTGAVLRPAAPAGLAERAVGAAQAIWPLVVVLSCRSARTGQLSQRVQVP